MSGTEYDLVAGYLKTARYALEQDACFGQVINLRLQHQGLPNGCPARIRVAVGPDAVVCRVINKGRDHRVFNRAAEPLLDFATKEMRGWSVRPNSCGTGEGKVFWKERLYRPRQLNPINRNYADLLQAVSSARTACVTRSRFKMSRPERWQSEYVDSGVYPVVWMVEASGTEVVIRIKNKGSNSDAFNHLGLLDVRVYQETQLGWSRSAGWSSWYRVQDFLGHAAARGALPISPESV